MKKKIFEKQIIDFETGEITSMTTVTASKFAESFSMCRTTSGIEWLFELTGNEIKTLIFLLELETEKRKLISLGPTDRKDLAEALNISVNSISRILKDLETKEYLIRINKQDLILNPKGFYKGSSKEVLPRILEFNKVLSSRKSTTLTPEVNNINSQSQEHADF